MRHQPQAPPLRALFQYKRLKQDCPLPLTALYLAWCVVVGPFLLVARLFVLLVALSVLVFFPTAGDLDLRILRLLLRWGCGWLISHVDADRYERGQVVASNHVSELDPLSFQAFARYHQLSIFPYWYLLPKKLSLIYARAKSGEREAVRDAIKLAIGRGDRPLLSFSEGGFTSGKVATMLFNKFNYSLDATVQPCALKVHNPWPVEHDILGTNVWVNFFHIFMFPWIEVEVKWLAPMSRRDGEDAAHFARRVQEAISRELGIAASHHMYKEKVQLVKDLKSHQAKCD